MPIALIAAAALSFAEPIHQQINFQTSPVAAARAANVYDALLDEKQFAAMSGAPALIDRTEGGTFQLFGGRITGRILELVPNQRIVEAWRKESWPKGVFSIVRFELSQTVNGVTMSFDHWGFPLIDRDTLADNWPKKYWKPLRQWLSLAGSIGPEAAK